MIIRTVYFTGQGQERARELFDGWEGFHPQYREGELSDWVKESFAWHLPLLFIGACGIAVRQIAPFVRDKTIDSPVLVMDEKGSFVIPILSGHLGGANHLARQIARRLKAQPVITTATDVNSLFAVDVFASGNALRVVNREGIRKVSSRILDGEKISISIDTTKIDVMQQPPSFIQMMPYPPMQEVDVLIGEQPQILTGSRKAAAGQASLYLAPRTLVAGMGCRRGKSGDELLAFFQKKMQELGLSEEDVRAQLCAIASVDVKQDEAGLEMLAQFYHVPYLTFSAGELEAMEGQFTESAFVQSAIGVSNVCERAAMCAAGKKGKLLLPKQAQNGMTLAVACRPGQILAWERQQEERIWR